MSIEERAIQLLEPFANDPCETKTGPSNCLRPRDPQGKNPWMYCLPCAARYVLRGPAPEPEETHE